MHQPSNVSSLRYLIIVLHNILIPLVITLNFESISAREDSKVLRQKGDSENVHSWSKFDVLDQNVYNIWKNFADGHDLDAAKIHHEDSNSTTVSVQSVTTSSTSKADHSDRVRRRRRRWPESILEECDPRTCRPPKCACASYSHPGNFPLSDVPMMIMLTFDDAVTSWGFDYFRRIMEEDFHNPNGCPIKMTFFVCDDGDNNYRLTRQLYQKGHEIASHSITHRYPETWWSDVASRRDYRTELVGQKTRLNRRAGIPWHEIRGMRVPFLATNGDNVGDIAQNNNFTYDSSCVGIYSLDDDHSPLWPYTLDHVPTEEICEQWPRPTRSFPGIWEVPLTKYSCEGRTENHMLDECQGFLGDDEKEDVLDFFMHHFDLHYKTRAPMGLFTHATFIRDQRGSLPGLIEFLREMTSRNNVWIVSVGQVVDWMKKPTSISDLKFFEPWGC